MCDQFGPSPAVLLLSLYQLRRVRQQVILAKASSNSPSLLCSTEKNPGWNNTRSRHRRRYERAMECITGRRPERGVRTGTVAIIANYGRRGVSLRMGAKRFRHGKNFRGQQ